MDLDPKVLQSIARHRRQARVQQARLLYPFALPLFLSALAVVVPFAAGLVVIEGSGGIFSGWAEPLESSFGSFPWEFYIRLAGLMALAVVAALLVSYLLKVRSLRRRFADRVRRWPEDIDSSVLLKFTEALDGVCIAAGVTSPALLVIVDESPNAMAFVDEEMGRCVAVTTGALKADLSVEEASAIMADLLARLLIGDRVDPPGVLQPEFMPNTMLLVFLLLVLAPLVLLNIESPYPEIVLLVSAACVPMMLILKWSETFNIRLMDLSAYHDDILADSIAVEITKDPAAVKSAIEKVARLARNTKGLVYISKYLFVSPWSTTGDYYRYSSRIFSPRPGSDGFSRIKWAIAGDVLELESGSTRDRIVNLDLVRYGSKRSLKDWEVGD